MDKIEKLEQEVNELKKQVTNLQQARVIRTCHYCGSGLTKNEEARGICDDCEYGEDDGMDEYFYIEQREKELEERAMNCSCGAWQNIKGRIVHVADCCCGAE